MKKNNQPFATFVNTKYIPLQKNHKLAGAAAVLILPLILFFFVLYLPKSKEIETLIQQKNTATQELQKARDTAATLNKHKAEMATIEEKFSETAVLFPKEMEIPRLLTDISAEGQSAGLEFLTFKPLAAVPKDFYSEIPISIKVNGPYH
ncbi:MAG: type 4a pilus biogenesis protein PilO, partial [Desulfocapsaceae bacterium]|nr:type 4a pilus biogenesis protein PilO [Desulfocapsaceae bacterium]